MTERQHVEQYDCTNRQTPGFGHSTMGSHYIHHNDVEQGAYYSSVYEMSETAFHDYTIYS